MGLDRIPLLRTDGSLWLCARRDIAGGPDRTLAAVGAGAVVCLLPDDELEWRSPSYLEWLRQHDGDRALWFPIPNYHAPTASEVMPFLRVVVERLESGAGIVMHCALGQGRAGTMAVCLLMMLGVDRHEALTTVAAHRPMAGPANAAQFGLVLGVEAALRDQ